MKFPSLGILSGITALAFLVTGPCLRAADAFIVVDNQTGQILTAKHANEKRQIASLTKLATALVVLDMVELKKLDLNEMVTVTASSARAGGANLVGLLEGDAVSVRDLLYCALLASDNTAASALAYHAGNRLPNPERLPPIENFVSHMNALARGLRMRQTLFLNPTGLDAGEPPLPYSSAADMARLTRYAYADPDIPYYVSQKSRAIAVTRGGQTLSIPIANTNELLGEDGIDGVKTGRTSKAGDCLILSSERAPEVRRDGATTYITPRRIHIVLLGSRDRASDGRALTQRGWADYDAWARDGRKPNRSKSIQP